MIKFIFFMYGLIILAVQLEQCGIPYFGPEYGIVTIVTGTEKEFYVKREVRGQNYDVVVISSNKDHCSKYDSNTDYVFSGQSNNLYYKLENDVLHLYISSPDKSIKQNSLPVDIKQHELSTGDFWRIDKIQQEKGLTKLVVPIDEKLRCQ